MNPGVRAESAIIDADFAIKVGRVEKFKLIKDVLPRLIDKLFIHRHVYDNEILIPPLVKEQIDSLIAKNKAVIVDREYIEKISPLQGLIYDDTINLLEKELEGTIRERKNWGEIVSLSFAKAVGITIFLSDESDLQDIINEKLYLNLPRTRAT